MLVPFAPRNGEQRLGDPLAESRGPTAKFSLADTLFLYRQNEFMDWLATRLASDSFFAARLEGKAEFPRLDMPASFSGERRDQEARKFQKLISNHSGLIVSDDTLGFYAEEVAPGRVIRAYDVLARALQCRSGIFGEAAHGIADPIAHMMSVVISKARSVNLFPLVFMDHLGDHGYKGIIQGVSDENREKLIRATPGLGEELLLQYKLCRGSDQRSICGKDVKQRDSIAAAAFAAQRIEAALEAQRTEAALVAQGESDLDLSTPYFALGPNLGRFAPVTKESRAIVKDWADSLELSMRASARHGLPEVVVLHDHHALMVEPNSRDPAFCGELMYQELSERGAKFSHICPCCSPLSEGAKLDTLNLIARELAQGCGVPNPALADRRQIDLPSGVNNVLFLMDPKSIEDSHFNDLTNDLLRKCQGFEVRFSNNLTEAGLFIESGRFSVVVLDYNSAATTNSLSKGEMAKFIRRYLTLNDISVITVNCHQNEVPVFGQGLHSQDGFDPDQLAMQIAILRTLRAA